MADCVPVKFTLRGKTSGDVFVLGSWNGWSHKTKLEESEDTLENSTWMTLPCGYYEYKFKINDHWIHDKTQPTVLNRFKTRNNFVNVVENPGIVVSDTSDQSKKTVNDKPGDLAGSQEKQEHPRYTEKSLTSILKPEKLATTEKQEGDDDTALKIDPLKDIEVESEQHFEHVVDMPQESLVDLEQVSSIEIKRFGSSQQSMEEEKVPEPCVTPARDDIKTITVELENEGGSTTNPDISENVETNSTSSKGSEEVVTKTAQDEDTVDLPVVIESSDETSVKASPVEEAYGTSEVGVGDMGKDTPFEEDEISPSICDNQKGAEMTFDQIHLLKDTPVKDKLEKEAENAAVHKETNVEGDKVTTERKLQQEVASYLAKDEETLSEVVETKESETVDRIIQPALEEEQLDKVALNTIDKSADETVPPKERHTKTAKVGSPVGEANENLAQEVAFKETTHKEDDISKAVLDSIKKVADDTCTKKEPQEQTHKKIAIGGLEEKPDEPVVEKHTQDERPITVEREDYEHVTKETEKSDRHVIQDILTVEEGIVSDEVEKVFEGKTLQEGKKAPLPPQSEPVDYVVQPVLQHEQIADHTISDEVSPLAEIGDDLKKEVPPQDETATKYSCEKTLQPTEHEVVKALDETAPKEAINNVEIMVDGVVQQITTTAIQEAGKDVSKTTPQQGTSESAAMDDLKTTTRENLTEATDEQDVTKKAVLKEFNNKDVNKVVAGEVPQQPSQEAVCSTVQDDLKEEIQVIPQTISEEGNVEISTNETEPKLVKADTNVADDSKESAAEVILPQVDTKAVPTDTNKAEVLTEMLQEKGNDETLIVVDVGRTTKIKLDVTANVPNTTEIEPQLEDGGVIEGIGREKDLPEDDTTKDAVSNIEKVTEKASFKAAPREITTYKVVQENVEKEAGTGDEVVKVAAKTVKPEVGEDAQDRLGKKAVETAQRPEMAEKAIFDKTRDNEDKDAIKEVPQGEKTIVDFPKEQETDKTKVHIERHHVEETDSKPNLDNIEAGVKPEEEATFIQQTIVKPPTEVERETGKPRQTVDKTEKHIPPPQEPKKSQDQEDAKLTESKKDSREEAMTEGADIPVHLPTEKQEKPKTPATPQSMESTKKKGGPASRLSFLKKDKSTVEKDDKSKPDEKKKDEKPTTEQEKSTTEKEKKPTSDDLPAEKPEKPQTPVLPESLSTKKTEGPTSRLTFRKKDKPTTEQEKSTTGKEKKPKSDDLPTEKREKPQTPVLPDSTKKTEGPTSRLAFWKKDKSTVEKEEKSKPEKKPSREELSTEKPQTPAIPESADETKNTEGPTSRFAFWKKKDKSTEKEPSEKASIEKKEKPATEEPTTEKDKAKTSDDVTDDVTKPQGFLGILRCCRCF